MDIKSDMRLTVSSLDSIEALTNINKVYMDYVTSNLHASMCEKNKLRIYRELKEKECPAYSNNRSVFINSLSKILCSDFYLMSAFGKTRYIFDQSIWECNVMIISSQILKAF